VAWRRGAFLERRPYLAALLSAQRRELEAVLCSQCTNNFCRDHLFVAVRQRDFGRYGFAQHESFSNERPHPAADDAMVAARFMRSIFPEQVNLKTILR
jgi:hypothetical protein